MSDIQEYINAVPVLTRRYMGLGLFMTLTGNLRIISLERVLWISKYFIENFHIWRFVTGYFYFGSTSISLLFNMLILGKYGSAMERDPFITSNYGKGADFIFCVLWLWTGSLLGLYMIKDTSLPVVEYVPFQSFLFGLIYLWSKRNPEALLSFWGFRFKGNYLPWVYLVYGFLMENGLGLATVLSLVGLVVAHLFYFAVEFLPVRYGREFVTTPEVMKSLYANVAGGTTTTPQVPNPQTARRGGTTNGSANSNPSNTGHNWGTGQRLGGS
eukprot:snap_masked-scaffold_1-processed-gene-20.47-mRNA-1 protein AED:1.00 eAED:1.00 QI:0/-1/0/0/-1/1/1/0/269